MTALLITLGIVLAMFGADMLVSDLLLGFLVAVLGILVLALGIVLLSRDENDCQESER